MKVWYVCQSYSSIECGSSDDYVLFSTQEKAEEKFMKIIESGKSLSGYLSTEWVLDNSSNEMFTAHDNNNSEFGSNMELFVGSYEVDSGKIL